MSRRSIEFALFLACFVATTTWAKEGEITEPPTQASGNTNAPSPQRLEELEALKSQLNQSVDTWVAKQVLGVNVDERQDAVVVSYGRLGSPASVKAWLDRKGISHHNILIQRYTSSVELGLDPATHPPYPFIGSF